MKKKHSGVMNMIYYIVGIAVLTFLDQITKIQAASNLKGKNAFVLIKDVFEFSYLENTGAAWGMFSGKRVFFLILTVVILAGITVIVYRIPVDKKYIPLRIVGILLAAGAIGNFIDRLMLGYVRDFIYFKLINFPVFNVADCYVTISVAMFILLIFLFKEEDFAFLSFKKSKEEDSLEEK